MFYVLITGGAGYIGSHITHLFQKAGYSTVVIDNLSTGHRDSVKNSIFIEGDVGDKNILIPLFQKYHFSCVIHLAGSSCVSDSVKNPTFYYKNNYENALHLLEIVTKFHVPHFIFSSSAAIYGEPCYIPIDIAHPLSPLNPYGESKHLVETALIKLHAKKKLNYISLRYFNAAGADFQSGLGERHEPETHLIPLCLKVAAKKQPFLTLYGRDFPTEDGTAIRDYIHVCDIARAHLLSFHYLLKERESGIFNLGTQTGTSIKNIISRIEKITKEKISICYADKRPGDPACLVADATDALNILNWKPLHNLDQIIRDAWEWEKIKSSFTSSSH